MRVLRKSAKSISLQTKISGADALVLKSDSLAQRGEYLLAVLLLYRALDVAVHDLINKNTPFLNWSTGVYDNIKESFLEVKQSLYSKNILPVKLGFSDALIVIHLCYPQIMPFSLLKEMVKLAELRHNTWLTHGKNIPTETDYLRMKKAYVPVVQQVLLENKKLFETRKLHVDNKMEGQ
ncbi:MAG: hypothetical protein H8E71_03985 [Candidatus Marinimicrobia bacterium]|nr:hypothetical protein [Candidatus Neomarinimicrobiota bacterium]